MVPNFWSLVFLQIFFGLGEIVFHEIEEGRVVVFGDASIAY